MTSFCENAIAYIKFDANSIPTSEKEHLVVDDDNAPVIRHLGNGMLVVYVVNNDEGLFYVHHHHLQASGIDVDQLHRIGLQNLRSYVADQLKVHKRGAIFTTLVDGNFEASLALVDDLWDKDLKSLVEGEIVMAMPERSVLAFCDSKSVEGIATLREVIRRVYDEAEHSLSQSLFIRRNGVWSKFEQN